MRSMDFSQGIEVCYEVCPYFPPQFRAFFVCILFLPMNPVLSLFSTGPMLSNLFLLALLWFNHIPSTICICCLHHTWRFFFDRCHVLCSTWWSRIQAYMRSVSIHHDIKRKVDGCVSTFWYMYISAYQEDLTPFCRGTPCKFFQMTYFWQLVTFSLSSYPTHSRLLRVVRWTITKALVGGLVPPSNAIHACLYNTLGNLKS